MDFMDSGQRDFFRYGSGSSGLGTPYSCIRLSLPSNMVSYSKKIFLAEIEGFK